MIIIEFTGGGAEHKFSLKGFTLAEVLITLGVIGIVSVMTLPALIANNRNKELENGLKKLILLWDRLLICIKPKMASELLRKIQVTTA